MCSWDRPVADTATWCLNTFPPIGVWPTSATSKWFVLALANFVVCCLSFVSRCFYSCFFVGISHYCLLSAPAIIFVYYLYVNVCVPMFVSRCFYCVLAGVRRRGIHRCTSALLRGILNSSTWRSTSTHPPCTPGMGGSLPSVLIFLTPNLREKGDE